MIEGVQPMAIPVWISVKDRLPDEEGTYLVATEKGGVLMTHFYLHGKRFSSARVNEHVTHWMPRPLPPKGGATNNDRV